MTVVVDANGSSYQMYETSVSGAEKLNIFSIEQANAYKSYKAFKNRYTIYEKNMCYGGQAIIRRAYDNL